MNTFASSIANAQFHSMSMSGNANSSLPKSKIAAVAICAFTLSSVGISTNISNPGLQFSNKSKREIVEFSNVKEKESKVFEFDNDKGVQDMNDIKLNEVQKYFDEKINNIKDTVHKIDTKISVMQNEQHHINEKIKEIDSKFNSIPDTIKETITSTLNEKALSKKQGFVSDYKAPIITGVLVSVISPAVILILAKIFGLFK